MVHSIFALRQFLVDSAKAEPTAIIFWKLSDDSSVAYHSGWYKPRRIYPERKPGTKYTDWGWEQTISWGWAYSLLETDRKLDIQPEISSQL